MPAMTLVIFAKISLGSTGGPAAENKVLAKHWFLAHALVYAPYGLVG